MCRWSWTPQSALWGCAARRARAGSSGRWGRSPPPGCQGCGEAAVWAWTGRWGRGSPARQQVVPKRVFVTIFKIFVGLFFFSFTYSAIFKTQLQCTVPWVKVPGNLGWLPHMLRIWYPHSVVLKGSRETNTSVVIISLKNARPALWMYFLCENNTAWIWSFNSKLFSTSRRQGNMWALIIEIPPLVPPPLHPLQLHLTPDGFHMSLWNSTKVVLSCVYWVYSSPEATRPSYRGVQFQHSHVWALWSRRHVAPDNCWSSVVPLRIPGYQRNFLRASRSWTKLRRFSCQPFQNNSQ